MTTVPEADAPQYADGTPVPLDIVDQSTAEWSRGYDPTLGVKNSTEPAERVPTVTAVSGGTLPTAGGGAARTITGTNLGGSTGVTAGGVAGTAFTVVDEQHATFIPGAHASGAVSLIVANPAGASTAFSVTYA